MGGSVKAKTRERRRPSGVAIAGLVVAILAAAGSGFSIYLQFFHRPYDMTVALERFEYVEEEGHPGGFVYGLRYVNTGRRGIVISGNALSLIYLPGRMNLLAPQTQLYASGEGTSFLLASGESVTKTYRQPWLQRMFVRTLNVTEQGGSEADAAIVVSIVGPDGTPLELWVGDLTVVFSDGEVSSTTFGNAVAYYEDARRARGDWLRTYNAAPARRVSK